MKKALIKNVCIFLFFVSVIILDFKRDMSSTYLLQVSITACLQTNIIFGSVFLQFFLSGNKCLPAGVQKPVDALKKTHQTIQNYCMF